MKHVWLRALFGVSLLINSALAIETGDPTEARRVLDQARAQTMSQIQPDGYWLIPSYLGAHFVSEYYLALKWTGWDRRSEFDETRFSKLLLEQQLTDGSWYAVKDVNLKTGDLNATIINYWALKVMGYSPELPNMTKARRWVLAHGGLAQSSTLTKVMLAIFGQESWSVVPLAPYFLFNDNLPINEHTTAQWVGPNLLQIAYLKNLKIGRDMGPRFGIGELRGVEPHRLHPIRIERIARTNRAAKKHVDLILERQLVGGSWGGYSVASFLGMIVLTDYQTRDTSKNQKIRPALERAFNYMERSFLKSGPSAYLGAQDSRYWDTALIGRGLLAAGQDRQSLDRSAEYLAATQVQRKSAHQAVATPIGFPFGDGFEDTPDTDDTAEITLFLHELGMTNTKLDQAMRWLDQMQNKDGGYGAFDKNNNNNFWVNLGAGKIKDTADLFDDSAADVTGHILESMALAGKNQNNSAVVRKAVKYLRHTQMPDGPWLGRWGVTYLYGTCAALTGLIQSGESLDSDSVKNALHWLLSKQNAEDGGFGETTLADSDYRQAGIGKSTPSQTAWALLALIEGKLANTSAARRAAQYLMNTFNSERGWVDPSVVGTGHPKIVYMQYPAYATAFSLLALAHYVRAREDSALPPPRVPIPSPL